MNSRWCSCTVGVGGELADWLGPFDRGARVCFDDDVCVWYSSRRRWDSGHTGPRSLTTRPTTTRPYIIERGSGSGGSGGGGGASALARAAAGAGGNA